MVTGDMLPDYAQNICLLKYHDVNDYISFWDKQ